MSLTAIVFIGIYIVGILLTLYHPIYGLFLYFFEWHNHPPYWWWGNEWPDPRWSLLIAILTLISFIINKKKLKQFGTFNFKPFIWLVLIVINAYIVSFLFAVVPSESYRKSEILLKLAINYLLMIYIIRNPGDYKWIIIVILLGVANFGRVTWEAGSNRDLGIMAPGATSGNLIAAYMMSIIPFFGIMFIYSKKWLKIFTLIALPFVFNALILENSRSTILGLVAMGMVMPFFFKGKIRIRVIIGLALAGLLFLQLTNPQFWERQETTAKYEEDSSAQKRFFLWKGGIRFVKDYPFGGGGEGFEELAHLYVPEMREIFLEKGNRTVHNTYLNVATDWGYQGLFLFLGWMIHTFIVILRIKRDAPKTSDFSFYNLQAAGIMLALIGALVAGIFTNRQYAENIFWFSTFAVALRNIQLNELSELQLQEENMEEEETTITGLNPLPLTQNHITSESL